MRPAKHVPCAGHYQYLGSRLAGVQLVHGRERYRLILVAVHEQHRLAQAGHKGWQVESRAVGEEVFGNLVVHRQLLAGAQVGHVEHAVVLPLLHYFGGPAWV